MGLQFYERIIERAHELLRKKNALYLNQEEQIFVLSQRLRRMRYKILYCLNFNVMRHMRLK